MPRFGRHNKDTCSWELGNSRINTKWRKRVNWTDHISERVISTSITVSKQHVLLMNVYFHHSGLQIVGGYFNAELRPGLGVERVSVGPHTLREGNKSGDCMKYWLMIQHFTKLNTMYRKTLEKQATYRTPKSAEKQLDYILVDREHMCCSRDAEANDTIHMGSDQRSVMAQFVITAPKKEVSQNSHIVKKKIITAESTKSQDDAKTRSDEANKFEECHAELERTNQHEAEIAATTQKPKMNESLSKSKQAEKSCRC